MYVLRKKGTINFICFAKTIDDLNKKINDHYWATKGCQQKGSIYEMDDFMKDKIISEVKIYDVIQED